MKNEILVLCIPVQTLPDLPLRSPETIYQQIFCPECHSLMWLGQRSKSLMLNGAKTLCALCGVQKAKAAGADLNTIPIVNLTGLEAERNK